MVKSWLRSSVGQIKSYRSALHILRPLAFVYFGIKTISIATSLEPSNSSQRKNRDVDFILIDRSNIIFYCFCRLAQNNI